MRRPVEEGDGSGCGDMFADLMDTRRKKEKKQTQVGMIVGSGG